jgi:hypothetical protein
MSMNATRLYRITYAIFIDWDMVARSPRGEVVYRLRIPGSTPFSDAEARLVAGAGGRAAVAIVEAETSAEVSYPPRSSPHLSVRSLRYEGSLWADASAAVLAADTSAQPSSEASGDNLERLFLMLYPPNIVSQRLMLLKGFNFFMPSVSKMYLDGSYFVNITPYVRAPEASKGKRNPRALHTQR